MSKNYNLEDSEESDNVLFEKFSKRTKDKKDKKKSLRDFRKNDDKRKFPEREQKNGEK